MKHLSLCFALSLLLASLAQGALPPLPAAATLAEAQSKAKSEQKLLMVVFKSFYCSHCKEFAEKVLDQPVFRTFAEEHLVMMIYDIAKPEEMPESERAVERSLEDKHQVTSTPTILVFDPAGKQLLRTEGYAGSTAEKVVANLNKLASTPSK
jgi:thioredoxin-related protein